MSIKNHLNQLIPEIIAKFPSIQVMYLFGSYASGTPKADSDADIAVFTDGSETPTMDLEVGVFKGKLKTFESFRNQIEKWIDPEESRENS